MAENRSGGESWPTTAARIAAGLLAVATGLLALLELYMVIAFLLDGDRESAEWTATPGFVALAAFMGGFVTLVARMKDRPDTDLGGDDGAVV